MSFGPCGGVASNGSCEVDSRRCPFLDQPVPQWLGTKHQPRAVDVPRVVVDHRPTGDPKADEHILASYRRTGVAVLLGDHLDDPHTTDRGETARRTAATGTTTLATITGRNRDDKQRRHLIEEFVDAGVAAVLCVTGDHPAARSIDGYDVEFRCDGTQLAHMARQLGAVVAVAESPSSPPRTKRAQRLRVKSDAGADFVILNHVAQRRRLEAFVDEAAGGAPDLGIIAAVPVITDTASARALDQFPGVELSASTVSEIVDAVDPVETGVSVAVRDAQHLLGRDHIAGVNLSGIASGAGPIERSSIMSEIAQRLTTPSVRSG